ncbi:hypothetical protein ABT218_13960 [Streptomyces sp. NPDC001455]|uniref:hypothetical protein n=1 Tax=Streptomyces sp. NPDC001455 TaxID=3154518 RepID=UPI003331E369
MPASRHEVPDLPLVLGRRLRPHGTRADRPAGGRTRALGDDGQIFHVSAVGERSRS